MNGPTNNTMRSSTVDNIKITRFLVVSLLFVITVVSAHFSVKKGSPILMFGIVVLPFVLMLMRHPALLLTFAVVMDATGFPVPGLSYTTLGLLAKLLMIGVAVLGFVLGQRAWKGRSMQESRPVLMFAGVVIVLMIFRGTGLRALGSSTWGGMVYINILAGVIFFFTVNGLKISAKHVRWMVWGSFIMGLGGALLQRVGFADAVETGTVAAQSRLMFLTPIANAIMPLALVVKFKRAPWINFLPLLLCLGLIGMTGFRSRLVGMIAVIASFYFFKSRNRIAYIFKAAGLGLICWITIVLASPMLPLGLQRAVSFVPGTQIDSRIADDAKGSIEWRVEIWRYCLERSPQYLLLGRGSTFDVWETSAELSQHDIGTYTPWFAFQTRSYHSGPLSLLIDYGLPGVIAALWLTFISFRHVWRLAKRLAGIDTFMSRYAIFLCANLLWMWFSFYFVYGGAVEFGGRIMYMGLVYVVCESVLRIEQEKEEESVNKPELDR